MADLIFPQAGDWINAAEAGQKAGMTDRRNAAVTNAGGFMANGDYAGAAKALYAGGDFAGGSQVAQAGYAQTENAMKLSRQQAVKAALDKQDIAGAYAAAGTDPELLGGLDKVTAHAKDTTATMASALQALKGPDGKWLDPATAAAKYAEIKPGLAARGIPQAQLDSFVPTPANLEAIQNQVLGLDKQLEMAKPVVVGDHLVRPTTGQSVYDAPKVVTVNKPSGGQSVISVPTGAAGAGDPTAGAPGVGGGNSPVAQALADPVPPTGGIYNHVAQVATAKGAKPEEVTYLQNLAHVESHGDPNAQNGKSTGLFQFHADTMAGAGGGDINSVDDQTAAALNLSRRDRANLQSLGVQPTDANTYIMHQQGAGGGRALLTAPPDVNAVSVLTPIYGSTKTATKAIVNNGGTPDMTAGQFVDMWRQRWANGGKPVASGSAGPATPAPAPQGQGGSHVLYDSDPEDTGSLTPAAIELMAGRYLVDGTIPPLGMKSTAARQAIINKATELAGTLGITGGDLASGIAGTKAGAAALTSTLKLKANVDQAEKTAEANGDLMLSLAPKGAGQTNIPVLNRWLQAGRKSIAGDPDVTRFNIAIGTFADEYAKVVAGQNGSTDSTRAEAYDRLSKFATQGQLAAGLATMKQEMANRSDALNEVEQGLRNKIRTGGSTMASGGAAPPTTAPAPSPAPAPTPTPNTAGRSPAQQREAAKYTDPSIPAGQPGNPLVPTTQAQFDKMKVGTWFINPADGRKMQKTH